ncbi:MAG: hypothetical protein A4E27_01463 [Methanobacterium sp. PtaU1.Bin242]|nr:MAG: hypothetical protein A4E27_01463 [Methanobacterium sp. PtaU1.Bin242]
MSHFSRIKTKITDKKLLIKCLYEMGFRIQENAEIRGYNGTKKVDLLVKMGRGYDVGFSKNAEGTYDILADWEGVKGANSDIFSADLNEQFKTVKNRIKREYAMKIVEEKTQNAGFDLLKKEEQSDGSIRILVRRWTEK